MARKQMEGDNPRRRTLARRARENGQRPSEAGVTLGATKQIRSLDHERRDGPASRGGKPAQEPAGSTPRGAAPEWPRPDATAPGLPARTGAVGYQELVDEVSRRAGVDFAQARAAAGATVAALARALDEGGRQRLLDAVPAQLHDGLLTVVDRHRDLAGFLAEVARLTGDTPEQARYQAQATLGTLADQDPRLVDSLSVPDELAQLLDPLPVGGGLVEPGQATPALDTTELRSALAGLPYWSVAGNELSRSIILPRENLDRVLGRLAGLRDETGRGPRIGRAAEDTATITLRTGRRGEGITALDVALARQVDAAIDEAGAGMA